MSDRINRKIRIEEIAAPSRELITTADEASAVLELAATRARYYMMGPCRIIVSLDPQGWHLSISCVNRDPTWDEIVTARYRLLPEVPEMAMHFPRLSNYVNLHPHVFHLHQCAEDE